MESLIQFITMTSIEFGHKLLRLESTLKYFAYSFTSNREDANDLIQDTYLRAITHKDAFDPSSNLKAWVYTIMRNTFINKYRKDKRANTIVDKTKELYYLSNLSQSGMVTPDSNYHHTELKEILNNLREKQRIPFQMHVQGYKYWEIADSLNISLGAVKSRISFSRKYLMEKLKDFAN